MAGPFVSLTWSVEVHLEDDAMVTIYQSPRVSGTRPTAYFGPVNAEGHCTTPKEFEELLLSVCRQIASRANTLEANSIVGCEVIADPFKVVDDKVAIHLHMVGTASRLEPLF